MLPASAMGYQPSRVPMPFAAEAAGPRIAPHWCGLIACSLLCLRPRARWDLTSSCHPSQGPEAYTAPTVFNLYSVGPNVSFTLNHFGGNRRRVEQQAALAEAQQYQLDAAYLTLTGNVVTQVVGMSAARAEIKAVEEIIANDKRTLR
jgi:outer membrane protein TolC